MVSLHGVVTPGLGQGAYFMGLPWVQEGVRRLLGFAPYPGTLNVRLDREGLAVWRRVRDSGAIVLAPPPPETCGARLVPTSIAVDTEAAVIVPDVTRYEEDLLELIAPVHIRSRLGYGDGELVTLRLRTPAS